MWRDRIPVWARSFADGPQRRTAMPRPPLPSRVVRSGTYAPDSRPPHVLSSYAVGLNPEAVEAWSLSDEVASAVALRLWSARDALLLQLGERLAFQSGDVAMLPDLVTRRAVPGSLRIWRIPASERFREEGGRLRADLTAMVGAGIAEEIWEAALLDPMFLGGGFQEITLSTYQSEGLGSGSFDSACIVVGSRSFGMPRSEFKRYGNLLPEDPQRESGQMIAEVLSSKAVVASPDAGPPLSAIFRPAAEMPPDPNESGFTKLLRQNSFKVAPAPVEPAMSVGLQDGAGPPAGALIESMLGAPSSSTGSP